MATPPITVKGMIYLSRILSNTLSSCLNPATCNPDEAILCAWALASIPDVLTQNIEKIVEKNTKNKTCVNPCNKYIGKNPPLITKSKRFVEPSQKANQKTSSPWNTFLTK